MGLGGDGLGRRHLGIEPDRALMGFVQMHGGGAEATASRQRPPVLGVACMRGHDLRPVPVGRLDQFLPGSAATETHLLSANHRPEGQVAGTTRQRLQNPTHQQQVGGTGQERTPRSPFPVDLTLNGGEHAWFALHLVQGDRVGTSNQRVGIAPGEVVHVQIVRGQVSPTRSTRVLFACESALPDLTHSRDNHGGHDPQHRV